jgi:MarR family transcriptional regulator, organic hydroperoxide resistance regulator
MSTPIYKSAYIQKKAYRVMDRQLNDALSPFDLNTTEWVVLGLINDDPQINLVEIARELNFEKAHITNMVKTLIAKQLVESSRNPEDRRELELYVTTQGRELMSQVENTVRNQMKVITYGITTEELVNYQKVLKKIIENEEKSRK